jgi:hypothetical protein
MEIILIIIQKVISNKNTASTVATKQYIINI